MEDIGLRPWIVSQCQTLHIVKPFVVQKQAIPLVLEGRDLIVCAATGQGKTAAYVLPLVQLFFERDRPSFFTLVLAPTRELICQVREQITIFGRGVDARVTCLIGGENVCEQKNALLDKPCHFIVATPGRLFDIVSGDAEIARRFRRVQALCLDECDRLLDPSMQEALDGIYSSLKLASIQKLCFSATITNSVVERLKSQLCMAENTVYLNVSENGGVGSPKKSVDGRAILTPESLEQFSYHCPQTPVNHILTYLLSEESKSVFSKRRGIIFTSTIESCELLHRALTNLKIPNARLHSLQKPEERTESVNDFKIETYRILVATSVASRGLDLPKVAWVINLTVPSLVDDYVHRVGRCARANAPGTSLTFVIHQNASEPSATRIRKIERALKLTIPHYKVDEEKALMFPNRVNKAFAKAKRHLEKDKFAERLERLRKRRRDENHEIKKQKKARQGESEK